MSKLIQISSIENKIYFIRNQRVMLDHDLAELYEVETRRLNEQVKRNIERFPEDFMFQLNKNEYDELRSQIATSKRGGRTYLPYAFTENGVAMLSSVLNSKKAIQVNIQIMRAFTRLRNLINYTGYNEFRQIISSLIEKTDKHDEQIHFLSAKLDIEIGRIDEILSLLIPKKIKTLGFKTGNEKDEDK